MCAAARMKAVFAGFPALYCLQPYVIAGLFAKSCQVTYTPTI